MHECFDYGPPIQYKVAVAVLCGNPHTKKNKLGLFIGV